MNGLINKQHTDEFKHTRYGLLGNVSDNGCGAIAAYNILNFEGIETSFDEVVKGIGMRLGMVIGLGKLGTNLISLMLYLAKYFVLRIRFLFLKRGRTMTNCSSVLIFYYWRSKKRIGAHYISAHRCEDGLFDVYNYAFRPIHVDLTEFISGMREKHEYPIWLVGIVKRKGKGR